MRADLPSAGDGEVALDLFQTGVGERRSVREDQGRDGPVAAIGGHHHARRSLVLLDVHLAVTDSFAVKMPLESHTVTTPCRGVHGQRVRYHRVVLPSGAGNLTYTTHRHPEHFRRRVLRGCPVMDDTPAHPILAGLDPQQAEAVRAVRGPVCILAGAGTGKTRTITHRMAYAVHTGTVPASQLLAVTFTTRAAGEMRGRLRALGAGAVQARTFHSAALRQLRYFAPRVLGGPLPEIIEQKWRAVAQA